MSGDSQSKSKRFTGKGRRMLAVLQDNLDGEACSTCRSNDWIWEEEIELLRSMNAVKRKVREARSNRDEPTVSHLRLEFERLRQEMEKFRRRRLDSLGFFDYD